MKDETTHTLLRNGMAVALMTLALTGALFMASCDSSDDSGGGSQINGTVDTFSAGGAFFKAARPGLWAALMDLVVSPALAGVPGVTVSVDGTDISTTTGDDGSFVLTEVPEGTHELVFTLDGVSATLTVTVPAGSVITISDIDVNGEDVSTGSVEVEEVESDNDNTVDEDVNDNVDDTANDNTDDTANDNVDDTANDNVDDTANDNVGDTANDNGDTNAVPDNSNDNI